MIRASSSLHAEALHVQIFKSSAKCSPRCDQDVQIDESDAECTSLVASCIQQMMVTPIDKSVSSGSDVAGVGGQLA